MKTIIRINPHAVDSPERIAAEKLPMLAVRMLAEAFSARTEVSEDALLVVEKGKGDRPVYMTVGAKPPEIAIGKRRVHAVFSPLDSQEPLATFFDLSSAEKWKDENWPSDSRIEEIDSTDLQVVRVAVAVIVLHDGKVLMGKLKRGGQYALPEGSLEIGESIESAAQRAVKATAGVTVGHVTVSKHAPYVNTLLNAGQHFVTLVVGAQLLAGEPKVVDPMWESCGWYDPETPPEPLFVTVKQIMYLAKRGHAKEQHAAPPEPAVAVPENPPSLVTAAAKARAQARASANKPKAGRQSGSRRSAR